MFCTCSRICSISTFMSTEMLVSSSAADFEPSVLASRCSSWIRKSSRLPISPPFSSRRSISSRCAAQPRQLLGDVDADREGGGFVQGALLRAPRARRAAVAPAARCASFQRSRKRCCCCSTSCGTSGSACRGQRAQLRQTRSSSIAASRAPSRSRAARPVRQRLRRRRARRRRPVAGGAAPRHQVQHLVPRDSGRARRAARRARCPASRGRRCSMRGLRLAAGVVGLGVRRRRAASILPRLKRAAISSRRAGSSCAQLLGQAEREVEEAAVDRADLDRRRRPAARASLAAVARRCVQLCCGAA